MKNKFLKREYNNGIHKNIPCFTLPYTGGKYNYTILSCVIAERGKNYLSSRGGEHGKLNFTMRVKGNLYDFLHDKFLFATYKTSKNLEVFKVECLSIAKAKINYIQQHKKCWIINITTTPRFCDGGYDEFIAKSF